MNIGDRVQLTVQYYKNRPINEQGELVRYFGADTIEIKMDFDNKVFMVNVRDVKFIEHVSVDDVVTLGYN